MTVASMSCGRNAGESLPPTAPDHFEGYAEIFRTALPAIKQR